MSSGKTTAPSGAATPVADTEERRALAAAIGEVAAKTRPVAAVRSADPEAAGECWSGLASVGVFGLALPPSHGGAGGGVLDASTALERCGAELVPGPVLPTVVGGLLLAGAGEQPVSDLCGYSHTNHSQGACSEGTLSFSLGLDPSELTATATADGLVVTGEVHALLGDGRPPAPEVTAELLLGARDGSGDERWFTLDASAPGVRITPRESVDPARPQAVVTLREVAVPADRVVTRLTGERVRSLAVTLAAAELSGVAGWCLRTAVEHARLREQFGRPIGSFQAVKHLCVEMLCHAEQISALAWDAARAADEDPGELPLAAAACGAFALDAAVQTAKDAIQVLGGIGFTWEHDAHLYLRRALATRSLLGPGAGWRLRLAELARRGDRRTLGVALDPATEADRPAVRASVAAIAELPEAQRRVALADSGLLTPHWPAPYGQDASPARQLLIDAELRRAGVTRPDLVIGGWAVPTLLRHGTPEQIDRFAARTLRGELTWCQLFSEPEAGSDLASLRTRAARVDGGWRLTGQKVWTSLARQADWAICLARTDPDAPKHRGIGYFLVDMTSPGIDIRPLREITGEAMFNEVFLDDVFVPSDCLVGSPTGGWALARTTLANERVAMGGGSALGEGVERLLAWAAEPEERVGALVAQGLAVSLLELRGTLRRLDGRDPGPESSVRKLVGVAHRQDVAEAALDLAGPAGASSEGATAPLVHEFLLSRCHSIAGGTTQILRTLIGERILGLPRER
ncbi:acyl-CoA dehydrogenase [Pseudonocardia eucalypti]|uniref:Acyl-CoA dehydrogenase n=1 Tax=Pseudonocardia eucalypti TaxID=648755 RepID=A0ABP9PHJ6_9PSEU|nr:alkylation response protein AidB-like acyl-CoA dehydrogenase [Pseudonocardia eucalypti]